MRSLTRWGCLLLLILSALGAARPRAAAAAPTIAVSGRQLLVNGAPFTVRGVNYKPTPTTGAANWGDDWTLYPAVVRADLAAMQAMGANAIRVYVSYERLFNNWDNHDPANDAADAATLANYRSLLAEANQRGIYVVMNYWLPYGADYRAQPQRGWHATRFRKIVNLFKDRAAYPNVLIWAFGNENNFAGNRGPLSAAELFDYFQEVVAGAKQIDTGHPYAVVLGDNLDLANAGLLNRAPAVDIWALNIYQTLQGYQNIANSFPLAKPLLFSEFGTDAYNNAAGRADEAAQATYYRQSWEQGVKPNLSAANAQRPVLGAMAFEWNDEWWKADGPRDRQDPGGWANANLPPDGFMNEEWFGLASALPEGSAGPRSYRQAYAALKALWATGAPTTPTPVPPTATPTPAPTPISLANPGFEAEGATQGPSGWGTWGPNGADYAADFTETYGGAHGGAYHLTHYAAQPYEVFTYQKRTGLAN
ncbi:MAG TPA: cellulase family glycosylhydrolase, partial [Herpetosiphonaceae bacterium]